MKTARVVIVGAGLSGLYAAFLLEQMEVQDYVILEGRNILGGRIVTAAASSAVALRDQHASNDIDRFDLGPTWFWPEYQRQLDHLLNDLGLERFEQHETGDMVVERSPDDDPMRVRGYVNSPTSMRLVGGMTALIDALDQRIDSARIKTGQSVRRIRNADRYVELDSENAAGDLTTWHAEHVLLAVPPRLVEHTIEFIPALPQVLSMQWRETATWIAPHSKYLAIYDTPFWRDRGLSGEARSARGPLGEIHDASMPGGRAALFGFFSAPARVRSGVSEDVLRTHCRAQLARLFGPQASSPKSESIKDWAKDPMTTVAADVGSPTQHAAAPAATPNSGPWKERLIGIASEWSPQFPGYVAGAVEAATLGVRSLRLFGT